jgi:hypothetical protein
LSLPLPAGDARIHPERQPIAPRAIYYRVIPPKEEWIPSPRPAVLAYTALDLKSPGIRITKLIIDLLRILPNARHPLASMYEVVRTQENNSSIIRRDDDLRLISKRIADGAELLPFFDIDVN